jgi:LPS sulfotransferase NodH
MQPFVIVGIQRTGTNLLVTSLNSHPDILCIGETFLSRGKSQYDYGHYRTLSWERRIGHYFDRRRQMRGYLDDFYETPGCAAIGLKLMQSQVRRYPMVWDYLCERRVKIIRVERRNQLKVLVSRMMSKRTGIPHSTTTFSSPRLHVPTWNLERKLDSITHENEGLSVLLEDVKYLRVVYERALAARQTEFRHVLEFLGVNLDVTLNSPYQKMAPNRLQDVIANFSDVGRCLSGTRYEGCMS